MSRTLRRSTALVLSAALVGSGAALAVPTVAWAATALPAGVTVANAGTLSAPDYTVTIDCDQLPDWDTYDYENERDWVYLPLHAEDTATIEFTGCGEFSIWDNDDDDDRVTPQFTYTDGPDAGNAQVMGDEWVSGDTIVPTGSAIEVGPDLELEFYDDEGDPRGYFYVETPLLVDVDDPVGSLLTDIELLVPADADPDLVVADDPQYWDDDDDLTLGGFDDCGIDSGDHFYASATVEVERSGTYTFRLADLLPTSRDLLWSEPERYLEDPFLALYSDFDPTDGHLGVVACDDDSDLDEFSDFYLTSSGTVMSDRYPQFTVELQPGSYTLVLTSYNPVDEFAVGSAPAAAPYDSTRESEKGDFSAAALGDDETGTVEVWFEAADLAATGTSPASGWMLASGLALMALGGLAFATRRRWSRA